jgi:hypothetical protein
MWLGQTCVQVLRVPRSNRSEVVPQWERDGIVTENLGLQGLTHHWQQPYFLSVTWPYSTSMAHGPRVACDPSVVCDRGRDSG